MILINEIVMQATTIKTQNSNTKPRTKPAEVRLDELMDTALDLFIRKGFEATTVSEITINADVAKGTFYHYFTSKNDIMTALRARFTQRVTEHLQHAMEQCPTTDFAARLRAWCVANVEYFLQNMAEHDALYNCHYHAQSNQDRDALLTQLVNLLQAGIAAGVWQSTNPWLTALTIYHGLHGAVDARACQAINVSTLGQELAQQFIHLLRNC